ncbi:MAG: lipopolysaccharide biosynthesis protein [Nitrospiraceae bacterium]
MSWSILGQALTALSQWGVLIVVVKFLSPENVGHFALSLGIVGPLFAFLNLQLSAIVASDHSRQHDAHTYVVLRSMTSALALSVVALIVFGGLVAADVSLPLSLIAGIKLCEAASDLAYGFLQRRERFDQIGLLQVIRGISSLAVTWGTSAISHNLVWVLSSLLLMQALLTVFVDFRALGLPSMPLIARIQACLGGQWHFSAVRTLFSIALSMGVVVGLNILTINLPRYWVAGWLGDAAVGIYAALSYTMTAGNMILGAVCQAALPRLARSYQNDHQAFRTLLGRLFVVALVSGALGLAFAAFASQQVLTLLYTPAIGSYRTTFTWIMVAAAVLYPISVTGCALTAARVYSEQAWVTLFSTISAAIACHVLVPTYGLDGAAMGIAVGFGIKLLGQLTLVLNLKAAHASHSYTQGAL